MPPNRTINYRLVADEPYTDYNLYKPFEGTANIGSEDLAISVWIDRTTAEEQAMQRQAAEERRRQEAEEARRRRLAAAALILEDWHWRRESSSYAIAEGRVTNNLSTPQRAVLAVIELYTADGQFITSEWSFIDFNPILPGQTSPFRIYIRYNPAMHRASLYFREFGGGSIPFISRNEVR